MRPIALSLLALAPVLALSSLPASAQQPTSNLNGINESLARQGEIRNMQQNQTSETNMIRMNQQRSQQYAPAPTGPTIVAPPR